MLDNEELLFDELYEKTKDCGRAQFIKLLMRKETQQKEFIKYLEDEKDRLARECSNIYEDSLGHTRLVNEDIFNEVNDISQKYKSIIGVLDENNKQ